MLGSRAIVIGSGIAGLSAAAALLDQFSSVLVLERDRTEAYGYPRPGVPQGRQPHLLLCGGAEALRMLFPDIETDFAAHGAVFFSPSVNMRHEFPGMATLPKREFGFRSISLPRPTLENVLRAWLARHPRVNLRNGARAAHIRTADGEAVGVEFTSRGAGRGFAAADLIVDATAQGSLILSCLEKLGHPPITTEQVHIDLGSASAIFSIPDIAQDLVSATTHPAPDSTRAGYMIRLSADSWHVLMIGRGKEHPPGDMAGFLEFARKLGTSTIADALRLAISAGPIARFRFPASIRRNYAAFDALPAGLLPIGDAMCRFNPVYGQGMTVAAQEALLLRHFLAASGGAGWKNDLAHSYLQASDKVIDRAWGFSVIPDFLYPQTVGSPPADLQERLDQRAERICRAVSDPVTHRELIQAQHLLPLPIPEESKPSLSGRLRG